MISKEPAEAHVKQIEEMLAPNVEGRRSQGPSAIRYAQ